jgi:hypothetical protein
MEQLQADFAGILGELQQVNEVNSRLLTMHLDYVHELMDTATRTVETTAYDAAAISTVRRARRKACSTQCGEVNMSSTFSGFDIARKALSVSQKAMEVTGHNIANANTPGYTRQRLVVASVEATGTQSRFAVSERGAVGGGVEAVTVEQIRNSFLDRQYWRKTPPAAS